MNEILRLEFMEWEWNWCDHQEARVARNRLKVNQDFRRGHQRMGAGFGVYTELYRPWWRFVFYFVHDEKLVEIYFILSFIWPSLVAQMVRTYRQCRRPGWDHLLIYWWEGMTWSEKCTCSQSCLPLWPHGR